MLYLLFHAWVYLSLPLFLANAGEWSTVYRDGGRYFSKVTSYLLLITSHNVTRYSYILL